MKRAKDLAGLTRMLKKHVNGKNVKIQKYGKTTEFLFPKPEFWASMVYQFTEFMPYGLGFRVEELDEFYLLSINE